MLIRWLPAATSSSRSRLGGHILVWSRFGGLHFSRRSFFFFFTPSPDEMQAHAGKAGRESHLADGVARGRWGGGLTGTPVLFLQLYWKSKTVLK